MYVLRLITCQALKVLDAGDVAGNGEAISECMACK